MEVSNNNFSFLSQNWSFFLQDAQQVGSYDIHDPCSAIYALRHNLSDEFIIHQSVEQMELATCKAYIQVRYQEPVYV